MKKKRPAPPASTLSQVKKQKRQAPPPPAVSSVFAGSWIGETQGFDDSPAHLWEISIPYPPYPQMLQVLNCWEGENSMRHFSGMMEPDGCSFKIGRFTGVLVDREHFWIPGWDTNDIRNDEGPDYDVVFSRPGLAELSAREVWLKVKDSVEESERTIDDD